MLHPHRWQVTLASALLACILHAGVVQASTVIRATHGNVTRATAQGIFVRPDLVVQQTAGNHSVGTAQPVGPSPLGEPITVVGSLTRAEPHAFFAFTTGTPMHLQVSAQVPARQFPALLVYNEDGLVIASAAGNAPDGSSAIIDLGPGTPGLVTVEVKPNPSHPEPAAQVFRYTLTIAPSARFVTVAGALTGNGTIADFYSFAANVGDHLTLTLAADPQARVELLLYDNHGNLVAIANGNAFDGASSRIDFTVPAGGGGTWIAEAASSPSVSPFATDYTLTIKGSTGTGPVVP